MGKISKVRFKKEKEGRQHDGVDDEEIQFLCGSHKVKKRLQKTTNESKLAPLSHPPASKSN